MDRLDYIVLAAGLLTPAFILFAERGQRGARKQPDPSDWPSVEGTVTSSRVAARSFFQDQRGLGGKWSSKEAHAAAVSFTYEFRGSRYTIGDQNPTGTTTTDKGRVEAIVSRYAVGRTVDVFVNPAQPSEGRLEPQHHGRMVLSLRAIFMLGFPLVAMLVVIFRDR